MNMASATVLIGVTPREGALEIVLIVGDPATQAAALIPRLRLDNDGNNRIGSLVTLDKGRLLVFITLGIRGGGPEP